jgi:hypothetical protein
MYIMYANASNNTPSYTHISLYEEFTPGEFGNILKSKWPLFDVKSMFVHVLHGFITSMQ